MCVCVGVHVWVCMCVCVGVHVYLCVCVYSMLFPSRKGGGVGLLLYGLFTN